MISFKVVLRSWFINSKKVIAKLLIGNLFKADSKCGLCITIHLPWWKYFGFPLFACLIVSRIFKTDFSEIWWETVELSNKENDSCLGLLKRWFGQPANVELKSAAICYTCWSFYKFLYKLNHGGLVNFQGAIFNSCLFCFLFIFFHLISWFFFILTICRHLGESVKSKFSNFLPTNVLFLIINPKLKAQYWIWRLWSWKVISAR